MAVRTVERAARQMRSDRKEGTPVTINERKALFDGIAPCRTQEEMRLHTTFRIGGPAELFVTPESEAALCRAVEACRAADLPYQIVGNGSNLLVSDEGIEGAVIAVGEGLDGVEPVPGGLRAGAGVRLSSLCRAAQAQGLSGLEFAFGIPGTLGGGLFMNAGAYGGELAQVVRRVRVLTREGELRTREAAQCAFGYRHSAFMDNGDVILAAELALTPDDPAAIEARMQTYLQRRKEKQPLEYPSAGSVFRRPAGHYAGALIERSGLKGARVGGAQVSEKHAGFIINCGGATAGDVRALIEQIQRKVRQDSGVELECEVRFIGRDAVPPTDKGR